MQTWRPSLSNDIRFENIVSQIFGGCRRISLVKENLSSNFEGLSLEEYWWDSCVSWIIDRVQSSPWRWWMIQKKWSVLNFWCDEEVYSISRTRWREKWSILRIKHDWIKYNLSWFKLHSSLFNTRIYGISRIFENSGSSKSVWEPSKKTDNFSGWSSLEIGLVEMWEIEIWLSGILLYLMRENLRIFKVHRIFDDFVLGEGFFLVKEKSWNYSRAIVFQ